MRPDEYRDMVRRFLAGGSGLTAKDLRDRGALVCGRSNALPTMQGGAAFKVNPTKGKGADGGAKRPH